MARYDRNLPIDLAVGDVLRARLFGERRRLESDAIFEGPVTVVAVTALPWVARLGPRWSIEFDRPAGVQFVAAYSGGDYQPGGDDVGNDYWVLSFLDRHDPLRPYGADGPTIGEALAMAVDVFSVSESANITWK